MKVHSLFDFWNNRQLLGINSNAAPSGYFLAYISNEFLLTFETWEILLKENVYAVLKADSCYTVQE